MPKNSVLALLLVAATGLCAQLPSVADESLKASASSTPEVPVSPTTPADVVSIACQTDSMLLTITPARPDPPDSHNHIDDDVYEQFNGIVYPAGLGTNSSCLREYRNQRGDLQYSLPLRSCNTMFTDNDDGTIEFFNNVVVQPHLTLVTGQGRGYQVRCRYQRRDLIQYHHLDAITPQRLRGNALDGDDDLEDDDETFPSCNMKIYKGDPENKQVAMNAKIGEDLTLVVSLEKQDKFGLLVSECNVRDGIGWAEQSLIADDGCPLDGEIMGMFQYSSDKQEARVSFQAHKFPYTASVYYTCEVKLCDLNHPTDCEPCSHKRRARRQAEVPAMVKVYSGLYVNDADNPELGEVVKTKNEDEICISQRNFAIGICIAGVILMIAVIAAIACILARRRNPKSYSRTGSSLYSGPYTNTGYSHTS